jgi:uncharacterized protein involved in exopolysaccharide biosynthesis
MTQTDAPETEILTPRDQLHRVTVLIRRSLRHFWKGCLVVLIGTGLSLGLALAKKRIYISEAVLLYRQIIRSTYLAGSEEQSGRHTPAIGHRLRELLLGRQNLEQVIRKYDLYRETVDRLGYVEAVNKMRGSIDYRIGGGDTFHIAFKGPTPQLAQQVTKQLADSLIEQELKLRTEQVRGTLRFLEAETSRMQKELQGKETRLAEFLAGHPEFAQEQVAGSGHLGAGASIRAIQRQKRRTDRSGDSTVQALKRQAQRIKTQISQGTTVVRLPPDPKLLQRQEQAEESLREARRALSQVQDQYTDRHPDVVAARARLKATKTRAKQVEQALKASRAVQRPATPIDKAELQSELDRIEREIASLRRAKRGGSTTSKKEGSSRANTIVALETKWNRLNRRVKEARDRYLKLEERQFRASLEASSALTGQAAQMTIIDPAYEPTRPAGVGRSIILISGFAVSCVIATLLLLGLGIMDERIYDRLDIERLRLTEVLVDIPRADKKARKRGTPARSGGPGAPRG